jgi:lipopolysaccharide transport system ATP-binding protein
MKPVIQVENLCKRYRLGLARGGRTLREVLCDAVTYPFRRARRRAAEAGPRELWALKDVSFEVNRGEVVGVIGRNGAGKSTVLKVLSRVTQPTSGTARIRGRLGSLLEVGTGFHPELTGRENIYLKGVLMGMSRREVARRFDEIVAFAEVDQFLDTPVKRYSSGMYVRLAFAVAAHLEPEILIVDEVLAVGDAAFQKKCLGRMGNIARSGRTILFVSHNMGVIQNLCDRALLLAGGRLVEAGPCAEVVAAYMSMGAEARQSGASLDAYRRPGAVPVLRAIELTNERGRPTTQFFTGGAMEVRIRYDSPVPLKAPVFGVFVHGLTGERLFHLQTLALHGPIEDLPQRGVAICRVPSLPLAPGRYLLSFNCSTVYTPGDLDYLEDPVAIDVDGADYFGTGRLPPPQNGPFLVKGSWEFSEDGAAAPGCVAQTA